MDAIKISVIRYLGHDPQPGIVECELVDSSGHRHTFIEKTAVVMSDSGPNDDLKSYPRPGLIACTILDESIDGSGRETVNVSTEEPWYIASTKDQTHFEVYKDQLTEVT